MRGLSSLVLSHLMRPAAKSQKDGQRVRIPDKPVRLLLALLEKPGEIISQEDLRTKSKQRVTRAMFGNIRMIPAGSWSCERTASGQTSATLGSSDEDWTQKDASPADASL